MEPYSLKTGFAPPWRQVSGRVSLYFSLLNDIFLSAVITGLIILVILNQRIWRKGAM